MFYSILYPMKEETEKSKNPPPCLKDLNLDQVFRTILKKEDKYDLEEIFYQPPGNVEGILYRQDVLKDLKNEEIYHSINCFSREMYKVSCEMEGLKEDLRSQDRIRSSNLTKGRFLACAKRYCENMDLLEEKTEEIQVKSEGLLKFLSYVKEYYHSESYQRFSGKVKDLQEKFSNLCYCMMIKNGTIHVRKYDGEEDLSIRIVKHFEKFRQDDVKDYHQKKTLQSKNLHVEAEILYLLEKVYPDEFKELENFAKEDLDFVDESIQRFSKEVRFYFAWLDYIKSMETAGLHFCCPKISEDGDDLYADQFFDLALAKQMGSKVVTNSFTMKLPERIFVVTGPNQGGKTTFARAFGQLHYLASLGLSIPGTNANLMFTDQVYTHFEKEEDLRIQSGKLQDDLERLHLILGKATKNSVIVVNEIFASTTLKDALLMGKRMMDALTELQAVCVIVTFLDELADYGPETVSLAGGVKEEDPRIRTFEIKRKEPEGLAYAMTIARNYSLTYEQIMRRLEK